MRIDTHFISTNVQTGLRVIKYKYYHLPYKPTGIGFSEKINGLNTLWGLRLLKENFSARGGGYLPMSYWSRRLLTSPIAYSLLLEQLGVC